MKTKLTDSYGNDQLDENGCVQYKQQNNWQVVFSDDYIEVHDKEGKILTWTKQEWQEDSNVPFYLANAIVKVANGELLP